MTQEIVRADQLDSYNNEREKSTMRGIENASFEMVQD